MRGVASLLIDGPDGRAIPVKEEVGLLLSAGAGHERCILLPVSKSVSYPEGQHADIQSSSPSNAMLALISSLSLPANDPIQGA